MATITSKGQITIPKAVRDALGLMEGTQVDFELGNGQAILRKRVPEAAFRRWEGYLAGKLPGRTVDETMEMLRGERLPPEGERG